MGLWGSWCSIGALAFAFSIDLYGKLPPSRLASVSNLRLFAAAVFNMSIDLYGVQGEEIEET